MQVSIIGGGIGGLAAALALHARGVEVRVFEQVPQIRALGVGINLLPHAVGVLSGFGLGPALDATGIRTRALVFMNRHGQEIFSDLRGLGAGYAHPQYSIHRGELQMILLEAATRALGGERILTGLRLGNFEELASGRVRANFVDRDGNPAASHESDLLIGADGIHSVVRARFYPDEGMPIWNGVTMWRGVTEGKPFLSGADMVQAGHRNQKFVVYPISRRHAERGAALINWIADLRQDGKQLLRREDWNKPGELAEFLPRFEGWRFPFLDVPGIMRAASSIYEFPMVDRDPLPRWSHGRVSLLGDAAHPMYPIGSNGATQAILDAAQLAESLAGIPDPVAALQDYESKRLPMTAEIVRMNRQQGIDAVLDLVEARAPDGFSNLNEVVPREELESIVGRYKAAAGHRQQNRTA